MKLFFILLSLTTLSFAYASPTNESDLVYLKEFTKEKRNLNKVKEKHLIRIFPLIGLSANKAEIIYNFIHRQNEIESFEDLLSLPEITTEDLAVLKDYFYLSVSTKEDKTVSEIIETIIEEKNLSEDSVVKEDLDEISKSPLNLNTASPEELSSLPWLTPFNIYTIIDYRNKKPFKKVEDLLELPGFDSEIVNNIKPFVTVELPTLKTIIKETEKTKKKQKPIKGEISYRTLSTLPLLKEHFQKVILPSSISSRLILRLNIIDNLFLGAITDQDRGERSFFDLYKFYLYFSTRTFLKKIVIGNFRVTAGQGLVVSDKGPYKSDNPSTARIGKSTDLKEDLSSYENRWFSGLGLLFKQKDYSGFLFLSFFPQDATVENNIITSFSPDSDGLHDTSSAESKKDKFIRQSFGGRLSKTFLLADPFHKLQIGVTGLYTKFPFIVNPPLNSYNLYTFRGKDLLSFGIDFDFILKNITFFGETSLCVRPDILSYTNKIIIPALYSGILFNIPKLETCIAFRYFPKEWFSFDAVPFREYESSAGETGLYNNNSFYITKNTKFNFGFDVFYSYWRRYDERIPPFGSEIFTGIKHRFSDKVILSAQIKSENKLIKFISGSTNIMTTADYDKRIRSELIIPVTYLMTLKFRAEYANTFIPEFKKEYNSILFFTDCKWNAAYDTYLFFRFIVFDTVYESQLWEYENDIPSYMSSFSLLGRGERFYILINKTVIPKTLSFHLKTAVTYYAKKLEDVKIEGDTLSESEEAEKFSGNFKYEVRCQIISKF